MHENDIYPLKYFHTLAVAFKVITVCVGVFPVFPENIYAVSNLHGYVQTRPIDFIDAVGPLAAN